MNEHKNLSKSHEEIFKDLSTKTYHEIIHIKYINAKRRKFCTLSNSPKKIIDEIELVFRDNKRDFYLFDTLNFRINNDKLKEQNWKTKWVTVKQDYEHSYGRIFDELKHLNEVEELMNKLFLHVKYNIPWANRDITDITEITGYWNYFKKLNM